MRGDPINEKEINQDEENQEQLVRHSSDLYVRPSWTDAIIAFDQIEKGKAIGHRSVIWIRAIIQNKLYKLGQRLQKNAGKVLFVSILFLASSCLALKSVQFHSKVDQLWIQQGGKLEKEIKYAVEALGEVEASTHQLVIQTPRNNGINILHAAALKEHLAVLKAATQVTVHLFDITWRLKDLCYAPTVPNFDAHYIDQIFDSIVPCTIITPLDCFWEGSKLLGPDYPVHLPGRQNKPPLQWTNLNPTKMLEEMKQSPFSFPYNTLEEYMKRAGIGTGYQMKPCLDPFDYDCPVTAPNKNSKQGPNIGSELTGGCYGFAAKYMHWPEELIVGGAKHNKTGHLVKAAALQSVIQLMGARELYEFLANTYRIHHIDWSQEKASQVLETWQRTFNKEIKKIQNLTESGSYNHYSFSTTTLNDILSKYSEISVIKIIIGLIIMLLYTGLVLSRWNDRIKSQAAVGIAGVILVFASIAAGLGLCAILSLPFNAATTQILPFLTMGLGIHDIFLLTHAYGDLSFNHIPISEQTGVVLKRSGMSVLTSGLSNIGAFFAATLIPVPALRVFAMQAGILLFLKLLVMFFVFPAIISLDLKRRRSGHSDMMCCCLPAFYSNHNNLAQYKSERTSNNCHQYNKYSPNKSNDKQIINVEREKNFSEKGAFIDFSQNRYTKFSLKLIVSKYYTPFVTRPATKAFAMVLFSSVLFASAWQAMNITDGLELTDLVPKNSNEQSFLAVQAKYFGFYNMYAITGRDFEYPTNQKLLYEYHDAFMRIKNVIKNDDGGLPAFWLSLFRDWLKNLQFAFDRDYKSNCITTERWYKNASDDGILAYKLLVQTGHVDNPIDKSLANQVRLVNSDGIINPKAFYNYLSAWVSNDALAYGASQANLRPEPRQWFYSNDHELKIPKSMPLTYAQMPFYLHKLMDTTQITELILNVRNLCRKFEEKGLPNFPSGILFLFWEQYMDLRSCLGLALIASLSVTLFVVGLMLLNIWATILVGIIIIGVVLQLLGVMGICGIKLSAVPAVLLVVSIGITVHFTVHVCLSFITTVGNRDRRIRLAIEQIWSPVIHGSFTTLLGAMMLAFSDFEFITRYFCTVFVCLIGIGAMNGLFFFPILLTLIGPSPEIIPVDHPDRISTPTPPVTPILRKNNPPPPPRRSYRIENARLHAEPSLTTITEEPNSWHSQQESCIIVQPEVKVETSTYNNQNCTGSDNTNSSITSTISQQPHITTKVTATVTAKVEVHTPLIGSMECNEKCHHSILNGKRASRCTSSMVNEMNPEFETEK